MTGVNVGYHRIAPKLVPFGERCEISSPYRTWFDGLLKWEEKIYQITKTDFSFRTVIAPAPSDPAEFVLDFSRGNGHENVIKFTARTALN